MSLPSNNKSNPVYIGLTGRAGAGKDTVAVYLENAIYELLDKEAESFALASVLKNGVSATFNIPFKYMVDRKLKEQFAPGYFMSPREMMQRFGSAMRKEFGNTVFINVLDAELNDALGMIDVAIITDIRYQNEAEWLLAKPDSVLIVIDRPGNTDGTIHQHESEKGIDLTALKCFDRIHSLNNDSDLHNLKALVEQLAAKLYRSTPVETK